MWATQGLQPGALRGDEGPEAGIITSGSATVLLRCDLLALGRSILRASARVCGALSVSTLDGEGPGGWQPPWEALGPGMP